MRQARRSLLHLQMGQEVLYLLMTIGILASLVLLVYAQFVRADNESLKKQHAEDAASMAVLKEKLAILPKDEDVPAPKPLPTPEPEKNDSPAVSEPPIDDQPPIITLSEAQGYYFPSGSAELSDGFRTLLAVDIVPRVLELSRKYQTSVIEVVGHTDEVPVRSRASTIDEGLLAFLSGKSSVTPAISDNVGLGMSRAAAVVRELARDPRLHAFTLLPLSAGQTTTTAYELSLGASAPNDEQRRRIEIRIRRKFSS